MGVAVRRDVLANRLAMVLFGAVALAGAINETCRVGDDGLLYYHIFTKARLKETARAGLSTLNDSVAAYAGAEVALRDLVEAGANLDSGDTSRVRDQLAGAIRLAGEVPGITLAYLHPDMRRRYASEYQEGLAQLLAGLENHDPALITQGVNKADAFSNWWNANVHDFMRAFAENTR